MTHTPALSRTAGGRGLLTGTQYTRGRPTYQASWILRADAGPRPLLASRAPPAAGPGVWLTIAGVTVAHCGDASSLAGAESWHSMWGLRFSWPLRTGHLP